MKYRLGLGDDAYLHLTEEQYKNLKECVIRCDDYSIKGKQITLDCDSKYPIVICSPIENFEVLDADIQS